MLSDVFRGSFTSAEKTIRFRAWFKKTIATRSAWVSDEEERKKQVLPDALVAFGVRPAAAKSSGRMLLQCCRVFMSPFD